MLASELQRMKKDLKIEIPKKKNKENPDLYDQKVRKLRILQAQEMIESETNPVRKRRMRFLFENGILDFTNV